MSKTPLVRMISALALLAAVSFWMGFPRQAGIPGSRPVWAWLLVSLAFNVSTSWLASRGWLLNLQTQRHPVQPREQLAGYWKGIALSPVGGMWATTLGRFWFSKDLSPSKKDLIRALLWEKVWVGASAVCSAVFLFILASALKHPPLTSIPYLLTGLVLGSLAVGYGAEGGSRSSLTRAWVNQVLLYGYAYPISVALSLLALARGLGVSSLETAIQASWQYVASWFIGQLAIIVPQGWGVRETCFVALTRHAMPVRWALGYSVWERALSALAQMTPALWSWSVRGDLQPASAASDYSSIFPNDAIYNPDSRHRKARRILRIVEDAAGRPLKTLQCLDIGCGEGHMTDIFAPHFATVYGLDADARSIEHANARMIDGHAPKFVLGSAEQLPFPDGSMDVVVCNQVYEHVTNPRAVMAEILRVLKPGGICYFAGHNRIGLFDGHYPIPTLSWWPPAWIDRLFRWSGRPSGYPVRLLSYWGMRNLIRRFDVQDYTIPVLKDPARWGAEEDIPGARAVRFLPAVLYKMVYPFLPGYLWVLKPR